MHPKKPQDRSKKDTQALNNLSLTVPITARTTPIRPISQKIRAPNFHMAICAVLSDSTNGLISKDEVMIVTVGGEQIDWLEEVPY